MGFARVWLFLVVFCVLALGGSGVYLSPIVLTLCLRMLENFFKSFEEQNLKSNSKSSLTILEDFELKYFFLMLLCRPQ